VDNAKHLTECLCCGSTNLRETLDLNEQPMANSFKKTQIEEELKFPLKLNLCTDCTHLQLSHAVNPDLLFKHYLYVSGTSQTLRDYFDWFANYTHQFFDNKPKTVLDIACNDGTQLDSFKKDGFTTYGIDPAENLHKLSSKNHDVICDYFTEQYVEQLKEKQLDVINAQNVFAHNSYPLDFLKMCKEIMHEDSVLFIQTSQADMVKNNEFDTIYHEHLSFFNANSMNALSERAGLHLVNVEKTPIHGNSYVFVFKKSPSQGNIKQVLAEERAQGAQDLETYNIYEQRCRQVLQELDARLCIYRLSQYTIVGYGAAAKGMTLINAGNLYLDFIIDDNPLKQGMFAPGSNIPIVSIDKLAEYTNNKLVFVPLAWNFFKEIKSKIKAKRNNNSDIFLKYFPKVEEE
jgi:2-polyprenyl-3-methyl-5-hydroxy-6-metoxy-1,4-benzoquinol methylase